MRHPLPHRLLNPLSVRIREDKDILENRRIRMCKEMGGYTLRSNMGECTRCVRVWEDTDVKGYRDMQTCEDMEGCMG
jgi:hypothetical protein